MPLPAHVQPAIRIGVSLDIAADQPARHIGLLEHDPLALVGERQLGTDLALLTLAEKLVEPIRHDVQRPVHVLRPGRGAGKPSELGVLQ